MILDFANGDPAMVSPLGSLPSSPGSILAYPLDDFFASPFNTSETAPKGFVGPYATVMPRIMKHLVDALESGGVDRKRRLAIATRWYAAAPQLLFRNPRKSSERISEVLRVRFRKFLRGDYAVFLEEWRRDYDKSPARERQAKVASVEDRNKEATKLAQRGFISWAVNSTSSFGIAPCTMKVIQQVPGKQPRPQIARGRCQYCPPMSRPISIAWRAS